MADRSVMPAVAGSNVIPFPSRDREDTRVEFLLRFHAADILHAEYRLSEARCWAARSLGSEAAIQGARDEHWHIHEQLVAATARLAEFPVSTWGQLRLK